MELFRKNKKQYVVEHVRGGSMSDDDLRHVLNVPAETPLWKGVLELIDRAEEEADKLFANIDATPDVRAEGGLVKATIRELRGQLEGWRASSVDSFKKGE